MAPFVVMVTKNHNVFLIGLMAVGKTTVGRLLSDELGLPFFDTDRVVEEKAGADIAWIFDKEGEAGFRDRECQVVDELTQRDGVVLATGGGVVLREENRRNLATRGVVVFLDSPIERLVERTRRDKRRPLLRQGDPRVTLERLVAGAGAVVRRHCRLPFLRGSTLGKGVGKRDCRSSAQQRVLRVIETLRVELGDRSYPIVIGAGLLSDRAQFAPYVAGQQVCIVTNETIAPLYLPSLRSDADRISCGRLRASRW